MNREWGVLRLRRLADEEHRRVIKELVDGIFEKMSSGEEPGL